jgi:hypothetical protein
MVSLSNRDKRVPLRELDQAYLEHIARVGVTGHSSLDNDWKVMRERFPAASVTKHEVEKLRSQFAPNQRLHGYAIGSLAGRQGRMPDPDPGRKRRRVSALATDVPATGLLEQGGRVKWPRPMPDRRTNSSIR